MVKHNSYPNFVRIFIFLMALEAIILLYRSDKVDHILSAVTLVAFVGGILYPKTRALLTDAKLDHIGLLIASFCGVVAMSALFFRMTTLQNKAPSYNWQAFLSTKPNSALVEGDKIPKGGFLTVRHPILSSGYPWVILRQPNRRYFPLTQEIVTSSCQITPGTNKGTLFDLALPQVGQAEDGVHSFELVFIVADLKANTTLLNTLKMWCKNKNYPGVPSLPPGCAQVSTISLKRQR